MMQMNRRLVAIISLLVLLLSVLPTGVIIRLVEAYDGYPVRNVDTGLNYTTIQEAIDAPETLDGHTILAEVGTYYEHVWINKSISLIGDNVQSTIIDGGGQLSVVKITASNVRVNNLTIRNSGSDYWGFPHGGIMLGSRDNTIKGNIITNGTGGIEASGSWNNVIENNVLLNNSDFGIDLYNSTDNEIGHNTISGCGSGVYFDSGSTRNLVLNNTLLSNGRGIYWNYAPKNIFRNNNLTDNGQGLGFGLALGLADFDQDIDTSNLINGKPVCYLVGQDDILVDPSTFPNGVGYLGIVGSANVTVTDLSVPSNGEGVLLAYTTNSKAQNITASDCYYGIHLENSSRNVIVDCKLSGTYGVWLVYSDENLVCNNTISKAGFGIELYHDVTGNSIKGNNVTSSTFGITSYPCYNNTVTENIVSTCSSGIFLRGSDNTITKNDVSYCTIGIDIGSSLTMVIDNLLTNNDMGIFVQGVDYNVIVGNTLMSNNQGFRIRYCNNNTFYHNDITNNTMQVYVLSAVNRWDNGYPSGGNYWSDYTGADANCDGIGDTPYVIDGNNVDNHPLMKPYAGVLGDINGDRKVNILDIVIVALAFGSQPGDANWNPIADMNKDGKVNILDIVLVAIHFGETG